MTSDKTIGIIGGGKFGLALANLIALNANVILYSRRIELVDSINKNNSVNEIKINDKVSATTSLEEVCDNCNLLLPVVASVHFRKVIKEMSSFLSPQHMLIHGTKGFDLLPGEIDEGFEYKDFRRRDVKTMSEVILEETDVIRVGALCGPNLASEILEGLPTATVIASEFDEVIKAGRQVLSGKSFFVFGSYDLRAAEITGALKNVIALASGLLGGKGLGKNSEAMLIVRGLREMVLLGELMGSSSRGFFGTAGIGDLIATATSNKSRNYSCGKRIAEGEHIGDILADADEVIEGIRTLRIAYFLVTKFNIHAPIISTIHKIIFGQKDIKSSIFDLMKYPLASDVDFV